MKCQRYLLQFYDRCPRRPRIETVDDYLEFQIKHVKLMPERRCRKGILSEAWWHVEAAQPASGYTCSFYIVHNVNKAGSLPLQVRESGTMYDLDNFDGLLRL